MNAFELVFACRQYQLMAGAITAGMLVPLLILAEFVFLEPYVVAHLPRGTEAGLALIAAISVLSGIVIPMNVYRMRAARESGAGAGAGIAGSLVGAAAGACSCGPVGFAIISTLGTVGGAATAFVTAYEMPLRIVSVCILGLAMYSTVRSLERRCRAMR